MAHTEACFHWSGSSRNFSYALKISVIGVFMDSAISLITLGCIATGPGDLLILSFFNLFKTLSSVKSMSSSVFLLFLSSKYGNSESGSKVKTLLKYFRNTSAFSSSFFVKAVCSPVFYFSKSGMPGLVFSLLCVYLQKAFGFDLIFFAIFFSITFLPLRVNRLIWFRSFF